MQWILEKWNIADALTRRNLVTHKILNAVLVTETLPRIVTSKAIRIMFPWQLGNFDKD